MNSDGEICCEKGRIPRKEFLAFDFLFVNKQHGSHCLLAFPVRFIFFHDKTTNYNTHKVEKQECDEEDLETWMSCDSEDCEFQILNAGEIVTSVQEESDPVDEKTDEDNNKNSKGPSNADAFLR
ncbi:UNVERIFIED_CONTAM: hypothetical protein NCL1_49162 [Trichonephila clavipes]